MRLAELEPTETEGIWRVKNVSLADPEAIPSWAEGWPSAPDGVGKGWTYDGVEFSAPAPTPAPVPKSVGKLPLYDALDDAGQDLDALVAQLSTKEQRRFELARTINRDDPNIASIQTGLGWTDAQVDDLFRDAAARDG